MDPNLIHLDWERTTEALMLIIVLAFTIERALAIVFESRVYLERFDRPGLKELVALAVSIGVCVAWKFDAISMFLLTAQTRPAGYILTGAVIAGGSKASIKLFHDLLNIKSSAYDQRYHLRAQRAAADAEAALVQAREGSGPIDQFERTAARALESATAAAQADGTTATQSAADRARAAKDEIERIAREHRQGLHA